MRPSLRRVTSRPKGGEKPSRHRRRCLTKEDAIDAIEKSSLQTEPTRCLPSQAQDKAETIQTRLKKKKKTEMPKEESSNELDARARRRRRRRGARRASCEPMRRERALTPGQPRTATHEKARTGSRDGGRARERRRTTFFPGEGQRAHACGGGDGAAAGQQKQAAGAAGAAEAGGAGGAGGSMQLEMCALEGEWSLKRRKGAIGRRRVGAPGRSFVFLSYSVFPPKDQTSF